MLAVGIRSEIRRIGQMRRQGTARWLAVRLLLESSRGYALALGVSALLATILPLALTVTMGRLVGLVPALAAHGFRSATGRQLVIAFIVVGVTLAMSLLIDPCQDALGAAIKTKLTYTMQQRLMTAVCGPTGVSHLEDPGTLNRIALAEGSLSSFYPADAPLVLARVTATRLTGVLACAGVGVFRWWLGAGFLFLWLGVRWPLRRVIIQHVRAFSGEANVMRRAAYFHGLATKPDAGKEIRLFGLGDWVAGQFRQSWLRGMAEVWRIRGHLNRTVLVAGCAVLAGYTLACGVLVLSVLHHAIGLSGVAILLPLLLMTSMAGGISFDDISLEWMVSALPQLAKLQRQLDGTRVPGSRNRLRPAHLPRERIEFRKVGFCYPGMDTAVFDDLTLSLRVGESTAVVGVNGSGKTTLVKLLARLHEPTSGQILADDDDLAGTDPASWQHLVAVISQDFVRYPVSAAENIGFGSVSASNDTAGLQESAALAGALPIIEALPHGWETRLSPRFSDGTDISDGQWQRIALARALFAVSHGACILVLDEPTAWLDAQREAEFFERFLEITKGLTTVIISHRFSTVRNAHSIYVIADGGVTESGTHDELIRQGGKYAEMFTLQAARFADAQAPDDGIAR